ncbi:MAG: hypothetical protein K6A05_01500 [Lachnospiraceae bacterium]|nr:hypothetical protein [Lachnospiraceae bacterium]
MKAVFVCSLIHRGLLGGGLLVEDSSITYKTGKVSVGSAYHNLRLEMVEINDVTWKWFIFPVATIEMNNGKQYRFLIFNKWRFTRVYEACKAQLA